MSVCLLLVNKGLAQKPSTLSNKIISKQEEYLPNFFIKLNPVCTEGVFDNRLLISDFKQSLGRLGFIAGSVDATLLMRKWLITYIHLSRPYINQFDAYYPYQYAKEYTITTTNTPVVYFNVEFGIGIHLKDTLFS